MASFPLESWNIVPMSTFLSVGQIMSGDNAKGFVEWNKYVELVI